MTDDTHVPRIQIPASTSASEEKSWERENREREEHLERLERILPRLMIRNILRKWSPKNPASPRLLANLLDGIETQLRVDLGYTGMADALREDIVEVAQSEPEEWASEKAATFMAGFMLADELNAMAYGTLRSHYQILNDSKSKLRLARSAGGLKSAETRRRKAESDKAKAAAAYKAERSRGGSRTDSVQHANQVTGISMTTLWRWEKDGELGQRLSS